MIKLLKCFGIAISILLLLASLFIHATYPRFLGGWEMVIGFCAFMSVGILLSNTTFKSPFKHNNSLPNWLKYSLCVFFVTLSISILIVLLPYVGVATNHLPKWFSFILGGAMLATAFPAMWVAFSIQFNEIFEKGSLGND